MRAQLRSWSQVLVCFLTRFWHSSVPFRITWPDPKHSHNSIFRLPLVHTKCTPLAGPPIFRDYQGLLVFGSPVRSGLLTSRAFNRNRNRSIYFRNPKKTGPNRCGPVHIGFLRLIVVFGSPVTGPEKDRDQTGPGPEKTGNFEDRKRP